MARLPFETRWRSASRATKPRAAFTGPRPAKGLWNFDDNIAHNNRVNGIFVWQNDGDFHQIKRFVAYHNGNLGIDHGAYGNGFQYSDLFLFGNGEGGFSSRAAASGSIFRDDGYSHAIERLRMTGKFVIGEHNSEYAAPTLVKDSVVGHVEVDERGKDLPGRYDFVNVTAADGISIEPSDFTFIAAKPESVYRVQRPDGTAFRIIGDNAVTQINAFYSPHDASATNNGIDSAGSSAGED